MLRLMKHFPRKWRPFTYYDRDNDDLYQGWWGWGYGMSIHLKNGKVLVFKTPDPISRRMVRLLRRILE